MSAVATDAREAGRRVDEVLDRLAATGDREACAAAEELVRVLMDFYGAGLARIVERLGVERLGGLLDDELVASLLALHDLHPEDVHTRIARALDAVRDPYRSSASTRPPASCGCGPRRAAAAAAVPVVTRSRRASRTPWPASRPR